MNPEAEKQRMKIRWFPKTDRSVPNPHLFEWDARVFYNPDRDETKVLIVARNSAADIISGRKARRVIAEGYAHRHPDDDDSFDVGVRVATRRALLAMATFIYEVDNESI